MVAYVQDQNLYRYTMYLGNKVERVFGAEHVGVSQGGLEPLRAIYLHNGVVMPTSTETWRKWNWRRWDQTWVPLLEGGLMLFMGGISLAFGAPLLFASLGPTAYEQIEKPELRSSRFYNVVVGHWIGMACGFAALALLHAWNAPNPMATGHFEPLRVAACSLAVALTALFTLLARAGQPAAYATAMLIALGSMQRARDAWYIALAVLILGIAGEPIRRMRLTPPQQRKEHAA